jgi:carbamoyl-phosphate synthase large subunit
VDFKCTAEGKAKVTEINVGRFGTTIHFYTMAGFNFPELAVNLALKGPGNDEALYDPIAEDIYWLRTLDCGPVLTTGRAFGKR